MPPPPAPRAREGNRGTTLHPGRPAHTPHTGTSGKPLPGLSPPYGPALPQVAPQVSRTEPFRARPGTPRPLRTNPAQPLDIDSKEDSIWTACQSSVPRPVEHISGFSALVSPGVPPAGGNRKNIHPDDRIVPAEELW